MVKKDRASPNSGNGFVPLPNKLVEALMRLNLSPRENRIFWVVIRETLGWGKKEKAISLVRFFELTGISKPHVCHALKKLQKRRIVVRNKNKFSLQEDYLRWKGIRKLPKQAKKTIAQTGNARLIIAQTGNASSLPKQAIKLPKQATNIAQTGNGKPELANEHKRNSAPKDIKDNIKDKGKSNGRTAAEIFLIFNGKILPKKIKSVIRNKDPNEIITLAKYCQEKEKKGWIRNAPGLWITLAKRNAKILGTGKEAIMPKHEGTGIFAFCPEEVVQVMQEKFPGKELEPALWKLMDKYHLKFEPADFHKFKEDLSGQERARLLDLAKKETGKS
ncbi:hypothetical protein ES705_41123 [subsurface metagenome]